MKGIGLEEENFKIIKSKIITEIFYLRNRSGIWGWRTDKNDTINGYDCRVYTANNLQLVTKTRVEHLNSERAREFLREQEENDLQNQMKQSNSNLPGFLGNFFQGSVQNVKVILFLYFKSKKKFIYYIQRPLSLIY